MVHRIARDGGNAMAALWEGESIVGIGDGPLLARFAADRDERSELAFSALVGRHGPMVFRICSQMLGDRHAAEDAFQAVFLILARKAGSIREPDKLGPWLHGVAVRTAREALRRDRRRLRRERAPIIDEQSASEDLLERREAAQTLHAEIARLPDRYRVPVILCDLQGLSHQEAAIRLRCPVSTVGVRLMRARDRLKSRLTRQGLAPSMAFLAFEHPEGWTVVAARFARSSLPSTAPAVILAQDVLRSLTMIRVKLSAVTLLALACVTAGAWSGLDRPARAQAVVDEVDVIKPVAQKVAEFADYTGRADASRTVSIRPRVSGNLEEVPSQGTKVEVGTRLFDIEDRPFQTRLYEENLKVEQAEARLKVREIDLVLAKSMPNQPQLVERAAAERDEAAVGVKIAQLAADRAKLDLERAVVRAPVAGELVHVSVQPGDYVKANETVLVTIDQTNPIAVNFELDEQTYLKIRRAAIANKVQGDIKLPAQVFLGGTEELPHRGEVRIGAVRFDPEKGTTTLTASIPNPDGTLVPGNFIRLRLETGPTHDSIFVPNSAVVSQGAKPVIQVVGPDDVVRIKPAAIREFHDGFYELTPDLGGDARVLATFNALLKDGTRIKPRLVPAKKGEAK